jgi:ribosome-binding factor A
MSWRIERLNEVLKEELGQIILRELEFPPGVLVTLTRVETSSELSQAKVFVSVFPEHQAGAVLQALNSQIYFLQQRVNKRLLMRPVPRLVFCPEKTTVSASHVEELLQGVSSDLLEKKRKKR